ncbi:MAG: rRNA maturation RNase YbeY [Acidobacteriota bacterium]
METDSLEGFLHELSSQMVLQAGFTVVLISDSAMRNYNRKFRDQNRTTDVLAFPDGEEAGPEESYLGDILVCVEAADRQKKTTLLEELKSLSLHGLLHLLGYDHHTDEGRMQTLERQLRREFQLH